MYILMKCKKQQWMILSFVAIVLAIDIIMQ